jgi:ABC-type Fe3+/spermidine/putrescine transport system ATPase subunit
VTLPQHVVAQGENHPAPEFVPDVRLEGVSKRFGDVVAVDEFSLDVPAGELLCLLGPSGCGKTTLLRMIAGLEDVTEGRIFIGTDEVGDKPPDKRDTAMVFQNWALFPHKTVFENVLFGLRMRGVRRRDAREKIAKYLELVRLPGLEDRMPGHLSGGQQQRVALARALIVEPRVLLLDEPLSNLDLKLRQQMRFEIRQIQQNLGITTIFVTHDQMEALEISDRIAVLASGAIEQIGTPQEVYSYPQSRFVAEFVGESNFITGQVIAGDGTHLQMIAGGGLSITVRSSGQLSEGDDVILSIRPEHVSLTVDQPAAQNRFRGRVALKAFMGAIVRYHVDLGEGIQIFVDRPNAVGEAVFEIGDNVFVSWEADEGPGCFPAALPRSDSV